MKIDNFALTMHQTCPAKYDLRMNQGWTSRKRSGALGGGSALHVGLATWYRTGELAQALLDINAAWPENLPVDDWRTKEKVLTVMIEYSKKYPIESFQVVGLPDNPVIEVPFTLETGMYLPCTKCSDSAEESSTPVCPCGEAKESIEYGGIYDLLVEFSGQLFVVDHKSTSLMGPSYFNQFKPNNQMTGYIWAASKLSGRQVSGAIINAIGWYKTGATKFERQITTRSPESIDEWLKDVYTECCNIQYHKIHGHYPKRTQACTLYGLCEYHSVHELDHEKDRQRRLETDYVKDHWDFENREN